MSTATAAPAVTDYSVIAEDAPIGVQLWPTTSPKFAPNFTLASVATVRNEVRSYVVWTYENGSQRTFEMGEQIACRGVQA